MRFRCINKNSQEWKHQSAKENMKKISEPVMDKKIQTTINQKIHAWKIVVEVHITWINKNAKCNQWENPCLENCGWSAHDMNQQKCKIRSIRKSMPEKL